MDTERSAPCNFPQIAALPVKRTRSTVDVLAMASGPHGARSALTGSIPVRLDTPDSVRTRADRSDRPQDDGFVRTAGRSPAMATVFEVLSTSNTVAMAGDRPTMRP